MKSRRSLLGFISFFLVFFSINANAAAIFNIVPSVTNLRILPAGLALISYTVTNNATKAISGVTVDPGYQHDGPAISGLTLQNDGCTNATLAPGASCTFQVTSPGTNSVTPFKLMPRVCGYNGAVCSVPPLAQRTLISTITPVVSPRAYIDLTTNPGGGGYVQIIDVATKALIGQLTLAANGINFADVPQGEAVTLDGSRVYFVNGNAANLIIYEVLTGVTTAVALPGATNIQGATLTPDESKLYIADAGGRVFVYNALTGAVTVITPLPNTTPAFIAISPDGTKAYVGSNSGTSVVLSTATNAVIATFPTPDFVTGLGLTPDGNRLFVSQAVTATVRVYNANTLALITTIALPAGSGPRPIIFTADGSTAFVGRSSAPGGVTIVNTTTYSTNNLTLLCPGAPAATDTRVLGLALTPDGSELYMQFQGTVVTNNASGGTGVLNVSTLAFSCIPLNTLVTVEQVGVGRFIG